MFAGYIEKNGRLVTEAGDHQLSVRVVSFQAAPVTTSQRREAIRKVLSPRLVFVFSELQTPITRYKALKRSGSFEFLDYFPHITLRLE